jgi:hypothetical protein
VHPISLLSSMYVAEEHTFASPEVEGLDTSAGWSCDEDGGSADSPGASSPKDRRRKKTKTGVYCSLFALCPAKSILRLCQNSAFDI